MAYARTTPHALAPLRAGAPEVAVSLSPQQSVYFELDRLVHHPARGPYGVDLALTRLARTVLPRIGEEEHCFVPNSTVPIVSQVDVTVREQVERLHDLPAEQLLADIAVAQGCDHGIHPAWAQVAQAPRRWLRAYAAASWAAWRELEPAWVGARTRFAREAERIGVAVVRGQLDAVLNTLSPRLRYADGRFVLGRDTVIAVGGRRIVLVPSLIASEAVLVHGDEPDTLSIAYPLRNADRLRRTGARVTDRVAAVLGEPRAALLRALDRPMPMGAVADLLDLAPASVTRHCDLLERAGLIERERRGRAVVVARTDEGGELLDVLG